MTEVSVVYSKCSCILCYKIHMHANLILMSIIKKTLFHEYQQ